MATEDVTRLPKWAQSKIHVLEIRLREANERNAPIDAGETDTRVRNWGEEDTHLPNHSHVTFNLDGMHEITCYVRDGVLDVNSSTGTLHIVPRASNSIHLMVPPR